ncbi:MAG TPA: STAS domain-containing protein [Solirubrobacteraceae bacterium]|jgi:anti-anti-sigma factor|nr:STAS domain-containing protein [Solirubrobacteraceae bacterium]
MGTQELLKVDVRQERDRVIIVLDGELDMANAPVLENAIDSADIDSRTPAPLVLDLDKLHFIDSTGLRIILSARERCRRAGREFAITRGSEQVQRLLNVTGVADHLRMITAPDEVLV